MEFIEKSTMLEYKQYTIQNDRIDELDKMMIFFFFVLLIFHVLKFPPNVFTFMWKYLFRSIWTIKFTSHTIFERFITIAINSIFQVFGKINFTNRGFSKIYLDQPKHFLRRTLLATHGVIGDDKGSTKQIMACIHQP